MNETHWLIPGRFGVMTGGITQKSVDAVATEAGNLPAISTGVYGHPRKRPAEIAYRTISV